MDTHENTVIEDNNSSSLHRNNEIHLDNTPSKDDMVLQILNITKKIVILHSTADKDTNDDKGKGREVLSASEP